jgi:uncharacterized iron-regulated membrane protein
MNDKTTAKRRARQATGVTRYILTVEDESGAVLRVERQAPGNAPPEELPVDEVLSRIQSPAAPAGASPAVVIYVNGDPGAISVRSHEVSAQPGPVQAVAQPRPWAGRLWRILPPPTTIKVLRPVARKNKT